MIRFKIGKRAWIIHLNILQILIQTWDFRSDVPKITILCLSWIPPLRWKFHMTGLDSPSSGEWIVVFNNGARIPDEDTRRLAFAVTEMAARELSNARAYVGA